MSDAVSYGSEPRNCGMPVTSGLAPLAMPSPALPPEKPEPTPIVTPGNSLSVRSTVSWPWSMNVLPEIVATDAVDVLSAPAALRETETRPICLIDVNDAALSCNFALVLEPAATVKLS